MFTDDFEELYNPIDAEDVSASIQDILRFTKNFDETIAESEAIRCFFKIYWLNNKITIEFGEEHITNETYYNTHEFETKATSRTVLQIQASAEEYADMLVDFIENRQFYNEVYGRRVDMLNFEKIKNMKIVTKMMI